ncbi:hypothetical protein HYZ97_01515 [Candidatus Pacearchaeota archaeon]|nr:hypothetical protein [Candidatus Pacearchaeota archaeon]
MERKHYDTRLAEQLCSNNGSREVALNREFQRWNELIEERIRDRQGARYGSRDAPLMQYAQDHARSGELGIDSEKFLVLVHPFYLSLSHMHLLQGEEAAEELQRYTNNLMQVMQPSFARERINVVIFETFHHYAAATSLMVERGLVNKVVFTGADSGAPAEEENIYFLAGRTVYLGGGYLRKCLSTAARRITYLKPAPRIYAVLNLILNSPRNGTIFPKKWQILDIHPEIGVNNTLLEDEAITR